MTRTRAITVFTLAAVLTSLVVAQPAQADLSLWHAGAGFRVGGIHFNIVLGRSGHDHAGDYYYRTRDTFSYRGSRCGTRCFHDRGYAYHHQSCPLVDRHLSHFRLDPHRVFSHYAPVIQRDHRGRYDRHDRYDRYDRYDRHDRYDDRYFEFRDRRHRHSRGRSCPHRH